MTEVALLLVLASIAYGIRRTLRIPLIPLLLVAGMGLRAAGAALGEEVARNALDIGLAVLVFGAGMELNPRRFGAQYRLVWAVGLVQFMGIGAAGVLVARWAGWSWLSSLYIGLAISTSSTLIIIRMLKGRQQMFEPFGRLVTGVLLLQDVLIILSIVILIRVSDGPWAVLRGLGGLSILLLMSVAGMRVVMPYLVLRLKIDRETLGLAILTVLFVFMGTAYLLNLPIITGAFLAGVSLSTFPVNSVARGQVGSLTAFFMPLFFIVLGSLIGWPSGDEWTLILLLTLLVLLGTPLLVVVVAERMQLTARSAIESGLLLAMTSEFSLVVALQGLLVGQIPENVFNVIAMVTVLTMTVTPLLATDRLTWRLMRVHPGSAPRQGTDTGALSGHIVMLGYGRGSSVVMKALKKAGHEVVIVNDDPVVVRELVDQGVHAVYGDGSDPRVLTLVRARQARLVISSMRRVSDAESVLRQLGPDGPDLIIRVFEPEEAERIERLGGLPVSSAEAAAAAFIKWHSQVFGEAASVELD